GDAGGATAAARLRRLSKDVKITMLEAGPDVSFANCGLPYYIGGDIQNRSKLILQSPESFRDLYDVQVDIETKATRIDRSAMIVTAYHKPSDKEVTYPYDALILAQGGKPIVPPLPGADKDHVFSLWTLQDMDRIDGFIEGREPRTAVVVGGGFIGLEMVEALRKRGIEVYVVERMPHIMPNMAPEIVGFLQSELEAYGVGIRTSRAVTEITDRTVQLDDGSSLDADMVLMSVGVKPTLDLAQNAGLTLGEAGGLLVDKYLRTSDENIYGVGDMVELEHKISGKKVRIPLAGPANRQGRIAASNALGEMREYHGAQGTSVVRVFEAVAGSTGLSLSQAGLAGFDAKAVTVHKEHHTSYYPGAVTVTVHLIYDKITGIVLGGQTAGYAGADKRLDIIAAAAAGKMTINDLSELDLAYSPPIGTANDVMNMAAFVAENRSSGFSPSLSVQELDAYIEGKQPVFVDVRDVFAFDAAHIPGAHHIPLTHLSRRIDELPADRAILVYGENGKKAHQALRQLVQAGFTDVTNISGGFISIERHARSMGFNNIQVPLLPVKSKLLTEETGTTSNATDSSAEIQAETPANDAIGNGPIVIDVRSPEECAAGMFPGAINIPLDELPDRVDNVGATDRPVTLYCASGARSAYGTKILQQLGFTDVSNGGGIMDMMMKS
ncbi:MAG: FAD-dependent oxidoreductase, partial [Spirochaetales bacterium]|nr:FAD-dependent oxidoreductase [Spirochaetales bacterium]